MIVLVFIFNHTDTFYVDVIYQIKLEPADSDDMFCHFNIAISLITYQIPRREIV